MLDAITKTAICYLLGSLLGALVVGKLYGGVDIRLQGSGNAGGTNALRTQGLSFAIWVMAIDIGKGWLAASVIPGLEPLFPGTHPILSSDWLAVFCSTAAVLGHVYPVFFGFRGGKGAATLLGIVLGLQPLAALVVMVVWVLTLLLTGFVGLATMFATAGFTAYQFFRAMDHSFTWFGLGMTAFVAFTNRANIGRMLKGTENRSKRFWLLRPR